MKINKDILEKVKDGWNGKVYRNSIFLNNNKIVLTPDEINTLSFVNGTQKMNEFDAFNAYDLTRNPHASLIDRIEASLNIEFVQKTGTYEGIEMLYIFATRDGKFIYGGCEAANKTQKTSTIEQHLEMMSLF